jgi:Flp pilus assembly protein CpaB
MRLFMARGRLRRRAVRFWLTTILLASLTFTVVSRAGARAELAERRWGRVVSVVVVGRPVAAGAVVAASSVAVAVVPRRLAPAGSVSSVGAAVGRVALVPLWPGEVLLSGRLAPEGLRGVAALVPPGMRAVAVPVSPDAAVRVSVGDAVDVLATFESAGADGAEGDPTVAVAESAVVVDVGEGSVTVAVEPQAAARVAFAVARGTVTLALTSPVVE